jgi:hypothetical protein
MDMSESTRGVLGRVVGTILVGLLPPTLNYRTVQYIVGNTGGSDVANVTSAVLDKASEVDLNVVGGRIRQYLPSKKASVCAIAAAALIGGAYGAYKLHRHHMSSSFEAQAAEATEFRDELDSSASELVAELHKSGLNEPVDVVPELEDVEEDTGVVAPKLVVEQVAYQRVVQAAPAGDACDEDNPPQLLIKSRMVPRVVAPPAAPLGKPRRTTGHKRPRKDLFYLAGVDARNALGLSVDNEANRLTARRYIRNYLVERGVRATHIMRYLPMALTVAMTPTKYELEAHKVDQTSFIQERRSQLTRSYYSFTSLMGTMLGFSGSPAGSC